MLSILLATLQPAQAADTVDPEEAGRQRTIVVTGTRLEHSAAALRACVKASCPPLQDMKLTLEHAENQFVAGEYAKARVTLRKGTKRNSDAGRAHPDALAGLFRANGRISRHLGNIADFRRSAIRTRDILRKAHGKDDPRVIVAQIAIGDGLLLSGYPDQAVRTYRKLIDRAASLELHRVAAYASIKRSIAYLHGASGQQSDEYRTGLAGLEAVVSEYADSAPDMAMLAKIQHWRITREDRNSETGLDVLIAKYAGSIEHETPLIVAQEPIDLSRLDKRDIFLVQARSRSVGQTNNERWIDVGFVIDPDGRTSDVEILAGDEEDNWASLVVKSIKTRRYLPPTGDSALFGRFRVERYSLNKPVGGSAGSGPTIARIDLTDDQGAQ